MNFTSLGLILLICVCNGFPVQIFFDIENDVYFKLYKRDSLTNYTIIHQNISESLPLDSFDPKIPTRICIHGYLASSGTIDQFREAFLNAGDFNFIIVDWTRGAFNVNYYVSKARITLVSKRYIIDLFIKVYKTNTIDRSQTNWHI